MNKPLEKKCFRCNNSVIVKYVRASKNYSRKNCWEYWTENEKNRGYYLCNDCLLELYHDHKREFRQLITSENKQKIFREYINKKTIEGKLKSSSFLVSNYIDNEKDSKNNSTKN